MRRLFMLALAAVVALSVASTASAHVLLVGTYHGIRGQYSSIQAAVNAAKPGDWILIGPGDYKTSSSHAPNGVPQSAAGILITKPRIYIRGMNRNTVIVDGTKPGSSPCSRAKSAQNFGPKTKHGPNGLNGIMVWKAADVWVQNLTVCNFLSGSGGEGQTGNEVWWNGGAGSGQIGGHGGYYGSYLNATSTFYGGAKPDTTAAQYGIFSSNWSGGTWYQDYASNFSDSGFYVGACRQACDQTLNHIWSEYSALGYSGSNSGGNLVVENSQFDNNTDGFDTNSQNGDNPPPQDGSCPGTAVSSITHTNSCWVFIHNYVHDNNNPSVPEVGAAGATPVGTGLSLSGARDDTIMDNRIVRNDAWGVLIQIYPDNGPPCTGGTVNVTVLGLLPVGCLFDPWGNAILDNAFADNGSYGHTTNGDIAALDALNGNPTSCYSGNTDPKGLTTSPAGLEQTYPTCNGSAVAANENESLAFELLCGNEGSLVGVNISCPGGTPYPKRTHVTMHPLPTKQLPTMPNPCAGVPKNAWCSGK